MVVTMPYLYKLLQTKWCLEVTIEIWPDWDSNSPTAAELCSYILTDRAIKP